MNHIGIIGYFLVQQDKIYKVNSLEVLNGCIPKDSFVVCQSNPMKDVLSETEKGWHQYIEIKDSKCEYHSYYNLVETGYYESYTWEKDKGLIGYKSGFGAGKDGIELVRK